MSDLQTADAPASAPADPTAPILPQTPPTGQAADTVDNGTLLQPPSMAAASTRSGLQLSLPSVGFSEEELTRRVRESAAGQQLRQCFPRWRTMNQHLTRRALHQLAANEVLDPNDARIWQGRDAHATAVLRRHGLSELKSTQLTNLALEALIDGQAAADRSAGLDWSRLHVPAALTAALAAAHAKVPIDLTDPRMWVKSEDKRGALAARLQLDPYEASALSRFVLANPERFDPNSPTSWRIASERWIALVRGQLSAPEKVARPVGLFLAPEESGGWALRPVLSLELIMLVCEHGGWVDRELASFALKLKSDRDRKAFLDRIPHATLTAQPASKEREASISAHAQAAGSVLSSAISPGAPAPADEWGRLEVAQRPGDTFVFEVLTRGTRGLPRRRLGSRRHGTKGEFSSTTSVSMELGEAVGVAQDTGLPLLLSTEAAGELAGLVKVGRLKGRPGYLSITAAEGVSARTERLPIDRALGRLRQLRGERRSVQVDAGARQLIRMATVRPLADDPILFPPQQLAAAVMAVGAGVNSSPVGTGKSIQTGRAIAHRAVLTTGFRGILVANGRLLKQWAKELAEGDPGRLAPIAPHVHQLMLDDQLPIAPQIASFHRRLGDRPGLVLCSRTILERFEHELEVITYHLLVGDEGHHLANPATTAHRTFRALRMRAVIDCWVLTANPQGKSSEDVDVLLGLGIGDEEMIDSRIASREAGDIVEASNAHRLRIGYGPTVQRVSREAMQPWMPKVLPAKALPVPPDPALAVLFEAIREGGRQAYRNLIGVLGDLRELEAGSELHAEALVELGRAQGQVLSNIGVFLDASVDPQTLEHSEAVLAQALVRDGVVRPAVLAGGQGEPTLRGVVADTITNVCQGEQMIVFAERVRCLRQLAGSLARRGIDAGVAHGGLSDNEFDALIRNFQRGEFKVLCAAKVASEGYNLQNASQLMNLDLPWIVRPLEQRIGRGDRPGSKRDYLQVWNPYVLGGCIPYIVGVLAPRAAEHHQLFDGFDGISVADSTVAGLLGEITAQVAEAKEHEGFRLTAARLRVAASVFGH